MPDRLFIIDGHALIFKMYYAFLRRPMINSKGMDTSILFGFTKYLLELIEREKPTHLAVAFDPPGGSFRNELYPEYKANRAETPQLVIDALEPLTELCADMNIPVLMVPGYEADDVIGSLAKRAAAEGYDVYMVTPDKDYGQLIQDNIRQYKPGRSGGDDEIVGYKEICEKYGILDPVQVIDMLTICGDTADNVPGVKGIGEVWAGKLISHYGSVENIYAHIGELSKKQAEMFEAARPHISLSKKLVTIKTDVPIDVPTSRMRLDMAFNPALADLFAKYEFNSLRRHITHIETSKPQGAEPSLVQVDVLRADAVQLSTAVCAAGKCAFIVETSGSGVFAQVSRITVATLARDVCIAADGDCAGFKAILEDPTITKFAFGVKAQMNALAASGVQLGGKIRDVELMHYLLDPERSHSLDTLARHYLGATILSDASQAGRTGSLFDDGPDTQGTSSRLEEAAAIMGIGARVWAEMQEAGLTQLYETVEEPLIGVLSRMERRGVKVQTEPLREFADSLRAEIAEKESFVRELAGNPGLNLSSPRQVGELIFENLKLDPRAKKGTKSGWSTDEATLLELQDRSPVVPAILEYRAAKKLLSTYIDPFPAYISPVDGRVHTTFNQALTATGRLSSSNPNLQNIPIRTERGRIIRRAFVPGEEGWSIMSADYSQIELRIMAHLSGDSHLVEAFRTGVDVHAATASKIFRLPVDKVTADQRRVAKTANFGIMYGISSFGLAQRLGVSRAEAKKIIDDYFESFPAIVSFIEKTKESARDKGYVETLLGRRRYIKDIDARNASLRALAERNAVNAPIQGTSADIIKIAMIRIDDALRDRGMRSRMVLQIHDELVFEVPEDEIKPLGILVREIMENVLTLSVPLTVECNYGKDWLEAH